MTLLQGKEAVIETRRPIESSNGMAVLAVGGVAGSVMIRVGSSFIILAMAGDTIRADPIEA